MNSEAGRPWMTVVIATYNSVRFLPKLNHILRDQLQPNNSQELEILAIDGGSTDGTTAVAAEMGFRVLNNPAGHAIAAKHIGLLEAKSRLVCFLDHDEFLVRKDSLYLRYELFQSHPQLRAVIASGYVFNSDDSTSNIYASEFGDPVSLVAYRCPNNIKYRERSFAKRMKTYVATEDAVFFQAGSERKPILCEMMAGSGVVDIDFFKNKFPEIISQPNIGPHLYYLLGKSDSIDLLGITKNDGVQHESAEDWKALTKKISWRINNAVNQTEIAASGFSGRAMSGIYSPRRQLFFYLVYSLSIIGPLMDSILLAVTRRRWGYLRHFGLTYYVLYTAIRLILTKRRDGSGVTRYDGSD